MVKVKLAFWYKGHNPGDVVEVSKEEADVMRREGRVAEVMPDKPKAEDKKSKPESK